MTTEEFNAIKWRLKGILLIHNARYSTHEGEYNGITITMQVCNRTLKCGGYGKPRTAYAVGLREFKNKVAQVVAVCNPFQGAEYANLKMLVKLFRQTLYAKE